MTDHFLRAFAETRAFLLGRPGRTQVTPDGQAVLFLRSPPRDPTLGLYELDVATGETRELVTPAALVPGGQEDLSDEEKARRERMRVTERGFTWFALSPDGAQVLLPFSGGLWLLDRETGDARALPVPAGGGVIDPRFSPDGQRVAFVHQHDLWVTGAAGLCRLTAGGSEDLMNGLPEFVAQEEMGRHEGYWWSPDAASLAYAQVDQAQVERFAIADPSRPERPPLVFPYPRPGRENARVRLGLVSLDGAAAAAPSPAAAAPETRWVTWDQQRYPYLARVLWDTPRAPLSLLVQTRDQRQAAFLAVDPADGSTRVLHLETDEAWVNLDPDLPRWLPDGSGFLWASERGGGRALELRRPDGSLERELLSGADRFLALAHVDRGSAEVTVLTGGPVGNRIERLRLRERVRQVLLDEGPGVEHAPTFSPDGSLLVDARTTRDGWPEVRVGKITAGARRFEGRRLPDVAEAPPFRVNLELTTVAVMGVEHGHELYAALVRPRAFVTGRRYPVLVQVYGGPHALTVKADMRQYLLAQWMADQGCIVVSIDNRGTPRRGRGWERAIKGRFGTVPLEDQVLGLQALAARQPELDLGRVGIFGWSFGGYMAALAVLRRPDVFKAAAAGAPVVDWLDYDTHYTERYLDLPDAAPDAYRDASLLTHAPALERPLLLIHGTADDNVYFFHSLKLARALLAAGRSFEFLPLPGVTHQVPDPPVREELWRRVTAFLLAKI